MSVDISPRAEAELEGIFAYGAGRWGWDRAQAYIDALIDAFDRIAARAVPWRPIAAEMGVVGYRYRCERHLIYWRVADGRVTIIAILHERMDQGVRLADGDD